MATMTTTLTNKTSDLLCENCGYSILSLPETGACPECGRNRALSLPQARVGTPWQKRPGVASWFQTAFLVVTSPRQYFDSLQIHQRGGRALLMTNLSIAAAFLAHPMVGTLWFDASRGQDIWTPRGFLSMVASATILWVAALVLLSTLTIIEYLGIRFFAARRQWRLLPVAALQICAHSSYIWIVASLLTIIGLSLSWMLPQFGGNTSLITFWDEIVRAARFLLPVMPPLIGFGLGLLWFEWLVYLGVRSCKFSNALPDAATLPPVRTQR